MFIGIQLLYVIVQTNSTVKPIASRQYSKPLRPKALNPFEFDEFAPASAGGSFVRLHHETYAAKGEFD